MTILTAGSSAMPSSAASSAVISPTESALRWSGRFKVRVAMPSASSRSRIAPGSAMLGVSFAVSSRGDFDPNDAKRPGDAWPRPREPPLQSAQRDRVHQAARGPERVRSALELERAAHADVALVAVGVVADLLQDRIDPFLVEPERLAVARADAQQALDARVGILQLLVDIGLGHAQFLGLDHRHQRPAHHVQPLVVAVADER